MTTLRTDSNISYIDEKKPARGTVLATDVYNRAAWLGLVAGMRSMMPGAALALTGNNTPRALKVVTSVLAVGEIIGDKLPTTPSRLDKGPFIGRLVTGAVAGALLCRRYQQPVLEGALRGAIGAAVGSIAGNAYRTFTSQVTDLPDTLLAGIEDGVAVTLALKATQDQEHKLKSL